MVMLLLLLLLLLGNSPSAPGGGRAALAATAAVQTPRDVALLSGDSLGEARALLRHAPALVSDVDPETGCTALIEAAKLGHADTVGLLLDAGADPAAACEEGRTALMFAAICSLQREQRHSACPEHLMHLDTDSHEKVVETLLSKSTAIVGATDRRGRTAMHFAAANGHDTVLARLIEAGATLNGVDNDGWSPLFYAVMRQDVTAVRLLLHHGSVVNLADWTGATALHHAAHVGDRDIVVELVTHNSDLRAVDTHRGLRASEMAGEQGHLEVAELLRDAEQQLSIVLTSVSDSAEL